MLTPPPAPPPPGPPLDAGRELARVVRAKWHVEWELHQLRRQLVASHAKQLEAERAAAAADRRYRDLTSTRRWQAVQRALLPLDRARGR